MPTQAKSLVEAFPSDPIRMADVISRFWGKVRKTQPNLCWEWAAVRDPDEYGIFCSGGRNLRASRVAYYLSTGIDPTGDSVVRHLCDNPPCCNPAHLQVGTTKDNNNDKSSRGRGRRGHKITEDQVREILIAVQNGETRAHLALRYKVSKGHITNIVRGRTHQRVTGIMFVGDKGPAVR